MRDQPALNVRTVESVSMPACRAPKLWSVAALVLGCSASVAPASIHFNDRIGSCSIVNTTNSKPSNAAAKTLQAVVNQGAKLGGTTAARIVSQVVKQQSAAMLLGTSSRLSGQIRQLASDVSSAYRRCFPTSVPVERSLGSLALSGRGALAVRFNATGCNKFTREELDIGRWVGDDASSLSSGPLSFNSQSGSGGDASSQNRSLASEIPPGCWNRLTAADSATGSQAAVTTPFMSDFGYLAGPVGLTSPDQGSKLETPPVFSASKSDSNLSAATTSQNPEPTTLVVWGLLAILVAASDHSRGLRACKTLIGKV